MIKYLRCIKLSICYMFLGISTRGWPQRKNFYLLLSFHSFHTWSYLFNLLFLTYPCTCSSHFSEGHPLAPTVSILLTHSLSFHSLAFFLCGQTLSRLTFSITPHFIPISTRHTFTNHSPSLTGFLR